MQFSQINWFKYAAPQRFYPLAGRAVPWFGALAAILAVVGLVIGLLVAPTDHQQGDAYRIIYIHVPAAWMSMVLYVAMAFWAAMGLIFNARLWARCWRTAIAPTGALMTFLVAVDGRACGDKPTWGTWWVWDARLTSELILLFLYIGYLSLHVALSKIRTPRRPRSRPCWRIVGVVNVPIIYFSVKWWNTLHQGASVSVTQGFERWPRRDACEAMLVMALAFWAYAIAIALARLRVIILARVRSIIQWVRAELGNA